MIPTADSDGPSTGGTLVVGPSWIGDMVMAQSLFAAIRARFPGEPLDVLAPPWALPILDFMPEVRSGVAVPLGHGRFGLATRWRVGRALRRHRHARAYVLPRAWKAALVPAFAAIPQRIGYIGEQRWGLLTEPRRLDTQRLPRTVDRFVDLTRPRGSAGAPQIVPPRLVVPSAAADAALAAHRQERPTGPLLALCPGAEYGPAKRWPPEHFAALARDHLRDGGAVWLFGGPGDRQAAETIAAQARGCFSLAGRTDLAQAVALLSLADRVVTNDSGLMHVAAALDRPLVALYGSSSPVMTPPLSERAAIVSLALACSPCFKRDCPLGHTDCLTKLTPDRVRAALAGLETPP